MDEIKVTEQITEGCDEATKTMPLDEFFAETDAVLSAATPLPWVWGQHSEPTAEELAAWMAVCVGKRDGATMQMAFVADPERGAEAYLQTAVFGNGPRSAANAQFAISVVNNYPLLRDIIRNRNATIATLRKALEDVRVIASNKDARGWNDFDWIDDIVSAALDKGSSDCK